MKLEERRFILLDDARVDNCIRTIKEMAPRRFPGGGFRRPYRVTIEPDFQDLTVEQRGGFHFLCGLLGKQTGYTEGEIKEMVKERVWGRDEKIGPDGRVYQVLRSSEHDLDGKTTNVIDYAALIDDVYILGGEAGVVLPILDRFRKRA